MSAADWIAADLADGRLRVWPMAGDEPLSGPLTGDVAHGEDIETSVLELAGPWLAADDATPVVVCGIPGPNSVDFRSVPCAPLAASTAVSVPTRDRRITIRTVPGLSQAAPAGVLEGEETRLAGFLAAEPDFDGVVCVARSRSAWVHVSAGEAVSFVSFMTGDLFEMICGSLGLPAQRPADPDAPGFLDAFSDAMSRPERLTADLMPLRAGAVLAGLEPDLARSRLLGLLIGAELAAARAYWLGRDVAVIGEAALAARYQAALASQGVSVRHVDEVEAVLAGLIAAHEMFGNKHK